MHEEERKTKGRQKERKTKSNFSFNFLFNFWTLKKLVELCMGVIYFEHNYKGFRLFVLCITLFIVELLVYQDATLNLQYRSLSARVKSIS